MFLVRLLLDKRYVKQARVGKLILLVQVVEVVVVILRELLLGTGLSGGGQSGSVTLNINSNRVPYYSSTISTGQALKKTSSGWTTYTPSSGAGVVSISQSAYNSLSTKQSVLYAITS